MRVLLLPAILIPHKYAPFRETVTSWYDSRRGANVKRTRHDGYFQCLVLLVQF